MNVKHRNDSLTHLPTREQLEIDSAAAISREDGVALALIDVDHFMEINDNYDHETGDHVLATFAKLLNEAFPKQAYRVSGDEFAVLLSGSSLEQAFLQMEEFRKSLAAVQAQFQAHAERPFEITITAGVAQYPRDAKDAPSLFRTADAALGSAKENGRNQVALPPNEEMVMKSCYYPSSLVRRLKSLSDKLKKKESILLREALSDLLRKYDRVEEQV
ncbi:GGDEF domain-containing protein [Paenibacillus thermotolerans]|uniref:GGDEF domain-containing protein n=1 Tax=Paenibacillus thermotolerans TaxID=3027807 RepID=UPI0023688716|nr:MULTISPECIES: GGDEF domain-containing protein [unclassified Paenibacillus]